MYEWHIITHYGLTLVTCIHWHAANCNIPSWHEPYTDMQPIATSLPGMSHTLTCSQLQYPFLAWAWRGNRCRHWKKHKAKDITPSTAWRREAWKEEALYSVPWKDERGPSSVKMNIGTVSNATLGKLLRDGVEHTDTSLKWTEVNCCTTYSQSTMPSILHTSPTATPLAPNFWTNKI